MTRSDTTRANSAGAARARTPQLSVIIPAYNEEQRLLPTLTAVHGWLAARPGRHEILVVDDGSDDDTGQVVRAFLVRHPRAPLRLITSARNQGKGHAVRAGMLAARGALRLFMDADNATPISELPRLLAAVEAGARIAIGSRRAAGAELRRRQPWFRRAWSALANRVVRAGLVQGIRDTQCGFKLFDADAAAAVFGPLRTRGWGFDLEVLALAQRQGLAIAEVPVCWTDDRRTRVHPLRDALRITGEFLRIRKMLAQPAGAG